MRCESSAASGTTGWVACVGGHILLEVAWLLSDPVRSAPVLVDLVGRSVCPYLGGLNYTGKSTSILLSDRKNLPIHIVGRNSF